MKRTILLTITLLVGIHNAANAEHFKAATMGAGKSTCAQFAEKYAASPDIVEDIFFSWTQGFMSGLNLEKIVTHRPSHDLNSITINTQQQIIREYCSAHHLDDYARAVFQLYYKLDTMPAPKQ